MVAMAAMVIIVDCPFQVEYSRVALRDRFDIQAPRRDDQARSFEAREIATGRPVLVHFLPSGSPLLDRVELLPSAERERVIERGEDAGEAYLITDRLAEFSGFSEWIAQGKSLSVGGAWQINPPAKSTPPSVLDAQLASLFDPPPPPAPTLASNVATPPVLTDTASVTLEMPAVKPLEPAAPQPGNEAGEFTRQFAPVIRPAPAPPSPPPAVSEPGEFTRQFAPVIRPAPAPTRQPGEFTELFESPLKPVAPPPIVPPAVSQNEPGEFTQMLQAHRPASPAPLPQTTAPPASTFVPPVPPRQNFQPGNGGEFTQVFGRSDIPAPPTALRPAAPPVPPPTVTQAFERPSSPPPPPIPTPPPVLTPPAPKAPGEYTRQFSVPAALTLGQPGAMPQAPRLSVPLPTVPTSPKRSVVPLILILTAFLLMVAAVVVYLVARPHGT
jgi:hypothetical protein